MSRWQCGCAGYMHCPLLLVGRRFLHAAAGICVTLDGHVIADHSEAVMLPCVAVHDSSVMTRLLIGVGLEEPGLERSRLVGTSLVGVRVVGISSAGNTLLGTSLIWAALI